MSEPRTTLYSFSFSHHGRYSSFHRLLHYAGDCRVMDVTLPWGVLLNGVWRRRVESRWQKLSEWRLRPVFARRQRQCVHFIYPENSLFRAPSWKGRHGMVLSCHQPAAYLKTMSRQVHRGFFRGLETADRVVLLSEQFRSDYESLCDARRLVTIPHGVDVHFFQPGEPLPERPLIITVGNWLRDYDFWAEVALKTGAEVPEVEFAVIASPQVVQRARSRTETKLAGRVRFLSNLTDGDLRSLYHRAAVLFLPLKDAGANNALLEALACGVPVVVTDLPAAREYAGDCGVYVPPGAVDESVSKLAELVGNCAQRTALREAGRRRAVEKLAWEIIAERYARLYADVLAGLA